MPTPNLMNALRASFTVVCLVALASAAHGETPITSCGQILDGGGTLAGDLDCTGVENNAIEIHHGTIALNGFTLTGGWGILCDGPCKVVGPGTITGSTQFAINAYRSTLKVINVTMTNNAFYALQCGKACSVDGSTMSGNGGGVRAGAKLKLSNSSITDSGYDAVNASNNAGSARVELRHATITGNQSGVATEKGAKIFDSVITGNGTWGVNGGWLGCHAKSGIRVERSTITGNTGDPACGVTTACFDVATCSEAPSLVDSTCEHSYVSNSGVPGNDWGVCTLD